MVPTFHPRRLGDSQSMFSMQSLYPEKMYKELFKPRFHLSPGQLYTLRKCINNCLNLGFYISPGQLYTLRKCIKNCLNLGFIYLRISCIP